MYKGKVFFGCALSILIFTTINLGIAPNISGKFREWGTLNCGKTYNLYKKAKDSGITGDELKYGFDWLNTECIRRNVMHNMEYDTITFNMALGLLCGILALLHLFDVKKEYVSKTGIIGLICGIIVFIQTLVYVIYNGLIYTNSYPIQASDGYEPVYKTDVDGAFAELDGDRYKCFYFDKQFNVHALYAKYDDLILSRYNYNVHLEEKYENDEVKNCILSPRYCQNDGYIDKSLVNYNCKYLYINRDGENWAQELKNRDISQRIVTTLILSIFVCISDLILAIFGFLLFSKPNDF